VTLRDGFAVNDSAPARVLVVVPTLDEAANLEAVVTELRRVRPADDLLVVDDASSDGTPALARRLGCAVLELPFHLGYGAAVQAGIKYALRRGYGCVVTFDADGQHDPGDVEGLVAGVRDGLDLVLGSRRLDARSHHGGPLRRWGRGLFSALARLLTGLPLTDPTSGLKALGPRGQALFALARFPDRFPDADALVVARRARLRLGERPARMRPSRNRRSMHGGARPLAYGFNMLFSLLVAALGRESDLRG
jgi:glycosyltransferase involved in cell wall biosynthesis